MLTAVYSGSFDPMHIGHLAILRGLSGDPCIGRTLLLVTPTSPFKQTGNDGGKRLQAAREAVLRHPELKNVEVSGFEFGLPSPWYTIDTLRALKRTRPEDEFVLAVGADHLAAIRRWHEYESLLKDFGIIVFPRRGDDCKVLRDNLMRENAQYRIRLMDAPLVDVSSSQIREMLSKGENIGGLLA